MDTHKLHEGYNAKNPVPKVALKSIIDPSSATETKVSTIKATSPNKSLTRTQAKGLRGRDKREEQEQDATEKSTRQMVKGREVRVKDPVTGEETVSNSTS